MAQRSATRGRRRRGFLSGSFFAAAFLILVVHSGLAHPVPSENHDRTILVRLTPTAVVVNYRLEVDEARAIRDIPMGEPAILAKVRSPRDFHEVYCRYFATILADNLVATLDGKELAFQAVDHEFQITDHLRCDYRFEAPWKPDADRLHQFTFREGNYDGDNFSILRLSLVPADGITLRELTAPAEALMARAASQRGPGDGERLRRVSGRFELTDLQPRGAYKPTLPPDPGQERRPPRREAAQARTPPPGQVGLPKPFEEAKSPREEHQLLYLLLDTRKGMLLLLLLAAGFGAAHALTPGHGKTLVAAYLVGERGTVWHACLLGLVTTITHTAAVLLVAAILPLFFGDSAPASVQAVFGLVGGLVIAGLGLWLLMTRLAGRADHVHLGSGHHHHHGHPHVPNPATAVSWWGLVVLGMSGGIIPCWDAIAMLGFAISAQRLWLGLPLLLAFSAGLASVLIAIGIGVVYARNLAGQKLDRWQPLVRTLPIASALVVTVLGLWLCYDSVHSR